MHTDTPQTALPLCPTAPHSSCHTAGTQPSCSRTHTAPAPHLTLIGNTAPSHPKAAFAKLSIPAGREPSILLLTTPARLQPCLTPRRMTYMHAGQYTLSKLCTTSHLLQRGATASSVQMSTPQLPSSLHCTVHSSEQNSPQLSNSYCHATERTAAAGQGAAVRHSGLHQRDNKSTVSNSQQSRAVTPCLPSAFSGEVTAVQLCSPTAFTVVSAANSMQLHHHSNSAHGGSPTDAATFASFIWVKVKAVCAESNCTVN